MACVPPRLKGKKIALLAATGIYEHEFWVPYYRLREEGANVIVCGPQKDTVYRGEGRHGKDGLDLARTDAAIDEMNADELDALIVPGGIHGPMALRRHEPALALVRAMDERKKIIASICHGPWVLVSADILRGRRATSPRDIEIDLRNAGAEWVNEQVVRDGNLITGVYYGYLPQFMRVVIDAIEGQ